MQQKWWWNGIYSWFTSSTRMRRGGSFLLWFSATILDFPYKIMHGVVVIFHSDLDLDLHTTFLSRSSLCSCSTVAFFHHCSMSKSLQSIRPALEWRAAQHGAVGFAWSLGAPRHFVWQVWHLVTLTSVLRGRCGTYGGGLKMVYTHKVAVWMG